MAKVFLQGKQAERRRMDTQAQNTGGGSAVAALALSTLLSSLGTGSVAVALPELAQAFGAGTQQVQRVLLSYLLSVTVLAAVAGWLGDRMGRRRVLLGGIAVFMAASLLCALAPTLPWLVAGRALQGAGAAAMMALSLAMSAAMASGGRVGSAVGLLGTMSAVGTALGPGLGGVLLAFSGWQALFYLNLPLGAAAFGLAWRGLPRAAAAPVTPSAPIARLLRDAQLLRHLATTALVVCVMMATLVAGPFYLSHTLGFDAIGVGLLMSCGPLVAALSGVPAGRLVDRAGTRATILAGLAILALGCAGMALPQVRLGAPAYLAALVLMTLGYALFQVANTTAAMARIDTGARGALAGLLALARNAGLLAGTAVLGALFGAGGMAWCFGAACVLVLLALLASMRAAPDGRQDVKDLP